MSLAATSPPAPQERYLTTRQVAELVGYSVDGLLSAVRRGAFPQPIRQSTKKYVWALTVVSAHMAMLQGAPGGPVHAA
jgi:predicted DNA-binding transcriptional regulator AlpA